MDIARSAVNNAKKIIALVNPRMPRTLGDGMIHYQHIDKMVYHEAELPEVDYSAKVTDIDRQIGRNIAEMVEDGPRSRWALVPFRMPFLPILEIIRI